MDLENYMPKHRNRVYYANSCCYCFQILIKLLRCARCFAVAYCSKEHQSRDWSFHKPTCIALNAIRREVQLPEVLDDGSFFSYRWELLEAMVRYRNLLGSEYLTEYERQICTLPWVCAVCFSSPTLFDCDICESVTYCSEEHQKKDEKDHKSNCRELQLCRIFSSLGYENGYKLKKLITYIYQPIRTGIRHWPKDMSSLAKLIQNETKTIGSPDDYINLCLFFEPYCPAAIIIHALDMSGYIKKRHLITTDNRNAENERRSRVNQNSVSSRTKSTMTVHFVNADDYELTFQWDKVVQLLKDWITNIDKVRIILIGPMLKECIIPIYDFRIDKSVEVFVLEKAYHEIDDLPAPDVIMFFECGRMFSAKYETKVWNVTDKNALFKYSNIPVVFCDGHSFPISKISNSFMLFPDIKCLVALNATDFAEKRTSRIWRGFMTTYIKNRIFSVFTKI